MDPGTIYRIYPIHVGTITRPKSNMVYMKGPDIRCDFPLIIWYMTDGRKNIVVDTGGTPPDGRYMPYVCPQEQLPGAALKAAGVDPDTVTDVILTHLHWDHAGNNRLFKNAVFHVQRKELQYAAAPLRIHEGSYDRRLVFETSYKALDGDCDILDGISVIATPGHSPGSQSVAVRTRSGIYVLAGDLIGLYECMEYEPMAVNSIHTDLVSYYESLARIGRMDCRVLPGHDFRVLDKKCYP